MISLLSLFVASLSSLSTANGVNICGTKLPTEGDINEAREVMKDWDDRISQTTNSNQTITVDAIWHRVTNGGLGNSENDVTKSMEVLNNAFEPHFKFNLLKKTVTDNRFYWNPTSYSDGGMRMHLHEGDCSILNIYSTNSLIAGFATFPSRCDYQQREDGVVINYETVPGGADLSWNEGYNLVHEVGHWLNLFHTFEGSCGNGSGDGIPDTPASRINRGCPQGKDSCPNEPGNDLIHNFMDYTDDSCRTSFTGGQFTAMKAAWHRYRNSRPSGPTTLPTSAPTAIGATNKPTRVYGSKKFIAYDELREQVMAYCDAPDTYDTSIYGAIEDWDVSQLTNMWGLFISEDDYGYAQINNCNPAIGKWDVSRVNTFDGMFSLTTFNQDISSWDVSKSTTFRSMFSDSSFNRDISSWDVSKSTDFDIMFGGSEFNQNIGSWDMSNCINFFGMFYDSSFNQDINNWDVSSGLYFKNMFFMNHQFNQDISSWDVTNGKVFDSMFEETTSFNQNISKWNLTGGTSFHWMLKGASAFNQYLDPWLKWVDKFKTSVDWCYGAICDANTALFPTTTPSSVPSISKLPTENKCTGFDKETCLNEQDICKYSNKKKVLGECQYKKKKYEHDCAQYTSIESCLSGFYPGMCKWIGNVCSHVCDGLSEKTCKKTVVFFNRVCTMPKIKNPCLGCHLKSKC